jgi:cell division septal protein FtsQ
MNKFYRIVLLLILFIFTSTYISKNTDLPLEKNSKFFKVQKIFVKNNFLVKKDYIYKKIDKLYGRNIFSIKRKDIEEPLKKIHFIEKIEVKKKYPNTIIIKIFETEPLAIIFKNKKKYLIDNLSNLIPLESNPQFNDLPSVFGENAEKQLASFFELLKNNNFPNKKIKNFYYFQIGRWDIQLENNKIIKFPHMNTNQAVKKSIDLLNQKAFKVYNIIDLRVNDKVIVE